MVVESLSRNVPVGVVANPHPVIENFSLHDLRVAQRNHGVWSRSIYGLESGDEINLQALPVPLRQFFLSDERVLCRYCPNKKQAVVQFIIQECYITTVLKQVYDTVIAGRPDKERRGG